MTRALLALVALAVLSACERKTHELQTENSETTQVAVVAPYPYGPPPPPQTPDWNERVLAQCLKETGIVGSGAYTNCVSETSEYD